MGPLVFGKCQVMLALLPNRLGAFGFLRGTSGERTLAATSTFSWGLCLTPCPSCKDIPTRCWVPPSNLAEKDGKLAEGRFEGVWKTEKKACEQDAPESNFEDMAVLQLQVWQPAISLPKIDCWHLLV